MEYRIEKDTMGDVRIREDKYWGAQTQRSLENFRIGSRIMPSEVIHALGVVKLASARANRVLRPEKMTEDKLLLIEKAASEVISGELDAHFPLVVFQTGSGTQSNMNVNEVIANRAAELAGERLLHPNDDINMSQSSNDAFPTAMHISSVLELEHSLIPSLTKLIAEFAALEKKNGDAYKSGRTHLQDATPITFAQEISGWRASLECDLELIRATTAPLRSLALGATAVGTGLNAPADFDVLVCEKISEITGESFTSCTNKFHALTSKCELVASHGALKALACDLMKIANDVRWLASGPRCALGEITIPENEPGSSIMPGKVNPTQCEAVTMVAVQVMANDTAVSLSASQGNFELNVFMPVCISNYLESVRLLSDVMTSFKEKCVCGIEANKSKMREYLDRSLMSVTALSTIIGYERCAKLAKLAHAENITLKEACLRLGYLSEEEFDRAYDPCKMV